MTSLEIRKKGEGIPRTEWLKQSLIGAHWENTVVSKSFYPVLPGPVLDDTDTLPGLQEEIQLQEAATQSVIKNNCGADQIYFITLLQSGIWINLANTQHFTLTLQPPVVNRWGRKKDSSTKDLDLRPLFPPLLTRILRYFAEHENKNRCTGKFKNDVFT